MTTTTGAARPTPAGHAPSRRRLILEGAVLLAATPFLLIPERLPLATLAALVALGSVWTLAILTTRQPASPFDITLLLWSVALIVGIVVTADPAETLPKATNLILGLGVWRFTVIAVRTLRQLAWATASFVLLGLSLSIVGIAGSQELPKIQFLADINPFQGRPLPGLGGVTIHPNQLAGLICVYLPVLVSLTFVPLPGFRSRPARFVLGLMTLLAVAILLLTQSRGGWAGMVVGLFGLLSLWALILPPSPLRRSLRLVAVVTIVAAVLVMVWVGPERLRELWSDPPKATAVGTLVTLNYRKELWPWAVTAVQDFPLTGVGLGAFREVAFRIYPLALSPTQDIGHAHNIFLQTALDTGLPGLVIYVAILLVAVAVGWRVARRSPALRPLSLGILAGLIAVHTFGLADALSLGAKPGIVFWFSLGLLAAMASMVSIPDRPD